MDLMDGWAWTKFCLYEGKLKEIYFQEQLLFPLYFLLQCVCFLLLLPLQFLPSLFSYRPQQHYLLCTRSSLSPLAQRLEYAVSHWARQKGCHEETGMGELESHLGFASAELVAGHLGPSSERKRASLETRAGVPLWVAVSLGATRTRVHEQRHWQHLLSSRPRSDTLLCH